MSRDDLLADVRTEATARPVTALPVPPPADVRTRPPTPTVGVSVTPLRWSLPKVSGTAGGIGLAVTVGPVSFSVALR